MTWVSSSERQKNFVPILKRKDWESPNFRQEKLESYHKQKKLKGDFV